MQIRYNLCYQYLLFTNESSQQQFIHLTCVPFQRHLQKLTLIFAKHILLISSLTTCIITLYDLTLVVACRVLSEWSMGGEKVMRTVLMAPASTLILRGLTVKYLEWGCDDGRASMEKSPDVCREGGGYCILIYRTAKNNSRKIFRKMLAPQY